MMAPMSVSDIAAVTRNNDGDFGSGNGWWVLIILLALFGGFGNRGYGYDGGYGTNQALSTDVATLERKLDGVNNGLCDGFYAQNTNNLNGIANVRADIAAGVSRMDNAICTLGYQNAQLINTVQAQLSDCCCQNREAIAQVRFDMATGNNSVVQAINQAAQNIMQNDNANYRALHDENVAAQLAAKDETIAQLRSQMDRDYTQCALNAQTATIRGYIQPVAQPAYIVDNPYCNCNNNRCGSCC